MFVGDLEEIILLREFKKGVLIMDKQWTLHIENLGKITEADVRISPLMLFVGDNNSGKSYVMSLLWGVLTLGKDIFPVKESEAQKYKLCEAWMINHQNKDITLTKSDEEMFVQWFNDLLDLKKKVLVETVFNYTMNIGKIQIKDYVREKPLAIRWNNSAERYSTKKNIVTFTTKPSYTKEDYLKMLIYICWNLLMEGIASPVYTPAAKGRRIGEPIYFPASRTGLMLTFPRLVTNTLGDSFRNPNVSLIDEQPPDNYLSLPYIDFLQLIVQFDSSLSSSKKDDLVDFIEERLLQGKVTADHHYKMPVIQYIPKGSKERLPLYVASSAVSEMSPLVLLLKSQIKYNAIIIEEPEGHLHPALQKLIARILIKLANSGKLVWVTTHSDTILQHINNMIKLSTHPNKVELMKAYKYLENDIIASQEISMYQFDVIEGNKTIIKSLKSNKYGFAIPTFNDTLEDLVDEVYAFQEEQ